VKRAPVKRESPKPIEQVGDSASLQPRIHRFTLHRKHAEHTLMHTVLRLVSDEPFECLDAECELAQGERALVLETRLAKAVEVLGQEVLGSP